MKTERVERGGRGCYVRECLCEVVAGGCRRWMIGVRIVWNISRVCERKGSRDCSMICVCVYH